MLQGLVYDYYVDEATCTMTPWADKVTPFSYQPDSFASLFVPTVETTRLTYFLDSLIANKYYVMFVGNTGRGPPAHSVQPLCKVEGNTSKFEKV